MLNVLKDGPFRYIHCAATGQLILTLFQRSGGKFEEYYDGKIEHTLREWKAIARKRINGRLITDDPSDHCY